MMTPRKPFAEPVVLDGTTIAGVEEALLLLTSVDWPGERGDRHAAAVDACLKVMDGHRSTIDARDRFVEAAREAGLLPDRSRQMPDPSTSNSSPS